MSPATTKRGRLVLVAAVVGLIVATCVPARSDVDVRFERLDGFDAPDTPADLDKVGFGGIPAPFAGLFNSSGSLGALLDPDAPSIGQTFALLPANLKAPIPVTDLAEYGYALDTETSPPGLIAAQAHLGHLAASGDPRGWDQAGEITPIQRYAEMFSGAGLVLIDRHETYAHNDPNSASPNNDFVDGLLPFLASVQRGPGRVGAGASGHVPPGRGGP